LYTRSPKLNFTKITNNDVACTRFSQNSESAHEHPFAEMKFNMYPNRISYDDELGYMGAQLNGRVT